MLWPEVISLPLSQWLISMSQERRTIIPANNINQFQLSLQKQSNGHRRVEFTSLIRLTNFCRAEFRLRLSFKFYAHCHIFQPERPTWRRWEIVPPHRPHSILMRLHTVLRWNRYKNIIWIILNAGYHRRWDCVRTWGIVLWRCSTHSWSTASRTRSERLMTTQWHLMTDVLVWYYCCVDFIDRCRMQIAIASALITDVDVPRNLAWSGLYSMICDKN